MSSSPSQNPEEPHGLLYILLAIASFFAGRFSSRPKPQAIRNQGESTMHHGDERERQSNQQKISGNMTVSYAEDVIRDLRTDSDENRAIQRSIRNATWAAFIAATAYASISVVILIEMRSQTTTARDQLESSERPWIKITDVKTIGNNPLGGSALSYQGFGHGPFPNGQQQATFQLIVSMTNVGHSLAFVSADYELFFPAWRQDKFEEIIIAEEKRYCDASEKLNIKNYPTSVAFPNDPIEWHGGANQLIRPLVGTNTVNHAPDDPAGDYVLPTIIVCANYKFRGSNKNFQTRTLYIVVHQQTGVRFFKVGEDVLERDLRMIRDESADDAF
jgi:hypothetical protein